MDDQLSSFGGQQDDQLKHVASAIWTDDEPSIRVFSEIFDGQDVAERVEDVLIADPVPTRRSVISTPNNCTTKHPSGTFPLFGYPNR